MSDDETEARDWLRHRGQYTANVAHHARHIGSRPVDTATLPAWVVVGEAMDGHPTVRVEVMGLVEHEARTAAANRAPNRADHAEAAATLAALVTAAPDVERLRELLSADRRPGVVVFLREMLPRVQDRVIGGMTAATGVELWTRFPGVAERSRYAGYRPVTTNQETACS